MIFSNLTGTLKSGLGLIKDFILLYLPGSYYRDTYSINSRHHFAALF